MRIQKEQLCDSCRKIHPVMNDGKPLDKSIEDLLDGGGYKHPNPMRYTILNEAILLYLQENGGCSRCIDLLKSAIPFSVF